MRKSVMVALVLSLAFVSTAAMAANMSDNYLTAKLGMYEPGSKTLGITNAPSGMKFKAGFDWELVYGRKVMPNLAVELGAGMFTTKSNNFTDNNFSGSGKIETIPITLSAKGIYPIDKIDLYALAGVGYYHSKAKFGSESKTKSAFGFQLGVGADYNFTDSIFAGLEAKYLFARPKFDETNGPGKVKLDGFQLTADIGYRF